LALFNFELLSLSFSLSTVCLKEPFIFQIIVNDAQQKEVHIHI
jgi:hypothetical protein